jgi:hypothetical protein
MTKKGSKTKAKRTMLVLAIDPGNIESAIVRYDTASRRPRSFATLPNDEVLGEVKRARASGVEHVAVEMIASYGMAVGREVFDTCVWIGRFIEAWDGPHTRVYRAEVKLHLCGVTRAKDTNVRQALLDRFGPGKDVAVGTKAKPGPLYGISGDAWAALAVAVTWGDKPYGRLST